MRAPFIAIALAVFLTACSADAQLTSLLGQTMNPVTESASEVQQSGTSAPRTGPAPAFDLGVFLETSFWVEGSEFRLASPADYFLLFPPTGFADGAVRGRYVLRVAGGREVQSTDLWHAGPTGSPAVVEVAARGGSLTVPESGAYVLEAEVGGLTVASVPFTAEVVESGDPFDPTPATRLDGPWRTHGYFIHDPERTDYVMEFHTWLRRDEPQGEQTTEVSVRRDGQEVAWGYGTADGSYDSWARVDYRLYAPEGRDRFGYQQANAPNWTLDDVTPGTYEVVLSMESGPFRTMSIEGAEGAFVPHSRSAIDIEPRSQYLTPRRMTGQMLRTPMHLDWVGPEAL
ncbi:hypothetical protein [Rubrivirga sp.]|uniref:hypothetical protein n=1 Tax=Rubrivirga sp. TaxID=1885344 RepID=UPI003C710319